MRRRKDSVMLGRYGGPICCPLSLLCLFVVAKLDGAFIRFLLVWSAISRVLVIDELREEHWRLRARAEGGGCRSRKA